MEAKRKLTKNKTVHHRPHPNFVRYKEVKVFSYKSGWVGLGIGNSWKTFEENEQTMEREEQTFNT